MRACVYTCLFGGYEQLSSQPAAAGSELPFICFTDDPNLVSDTWEIRHVQPLLPDDSRRSSRYPKICAHKFLPEFEASLYIDNSVLLLRRPEVLLAALLDSEDSNMACLRHSYWDSVDAEFAAVKQYSFEHDAVLLRQIRAYSELGYDFRGTQIWAGILLRLHLMPDVIRCMEDWFANVLQFSRRDQLSFDYVARLNNFRFKAHELDNHETAFHRWPVHRQRLANDIRKDTPLPTMALNGEDLRELEERLLAMRKRSSEMSDLATARARTPGLQDP